MTQTASAQDTEEERQNWHWRNTMRPVRFFSLDARAAFPFIVLLFYFRTHTLIMTILVTMVFRYFEKKGYSFSDAMRAFRVWMIGEKRYAWMSHKRRRLRDYG